MPTKSEPPQETEEVVQVVVSSFPKRLLAEIDAQAKRNNRTRAAEIRNILAERVALRKQAAAA